MAETTPQPPTATRPRRHVGVVVARNLDFARQVTQGFLAFALTRPNWSLRFAGEPEEWRALARSGTVFDGLLTYAPDHRQAALLREMCAGPIVNISNRSADLPFLGVISDDVEAGRLAARYFQEKRFAHFLFVGQRGMHFSVERQRGLEEACAVAGGWFRAVLSSLPEDIAAVLRGAPLPLAVVAATDWLAIRALEAAALAELSVPQQVAVVGFDNDAMHCEMAPVPLSSVLLGTEAMGRRAGELLDHLMAGGAPPAGKVRVPPARVVERRSSDTVAIPDEVAVLAAHFMRETSARGLTVAEIARELGVGRRTLERRFEQYLHCSPLEYLHRLRVRAAQRLLRESEAPVEAVATACGFSQARVMMRVFRTYVGCTPNAYRRLPAGAPVMEESAVLGQGR